MIFGYARVSTSEQNTDLQRDALEGAGVDPKNIFEDRGISGATQATQRQGFSELMKRVQDGDGIVVWKLDRLGRSMETPCKDRDVCRILPILIVQCLLSKAPDVVEEARLEELRIRTVPLEEDV